MSTAEILSLVSLISYIVAGVCFALAAFFWFFFKIPTVIGDLSGRTAKKSIEKIRQANTRTGSKYYRTSTTNAARGKLTETMSQPAKKQENTPQRNGVAAEIGRPATGILSENKADAGVQEETEALNIGETTGLLVNGEAAAAMNVRPAPARRTGGKKLTMINEIMLIHTNEVI